MLWCWAQDFYEVFREELRAGFDGGRSNDERVIV